MRGKRANQTSDAELAEARAEIVVLNDELLRLKLAAQRESRTSMAFNRLRELPEAISSTDAGDDAWQVLAEVLNTRDVLCQASNEFISAVDEIRNRLLEVPTIPADTSELLDLRPLPSTESSGEICLECGDGPFIRLASHTRKHTAGNGELTQTGPKRGSDAKGRWRPEPATD